MSDLTPERVAELQQLCDTARQARPRAERIVGAVCIFEGLWGVLETAEAVTRDLRAERERSWALAEWIVEQANKTPKSEGDQHDD